MTVVDLRIFSCPKFRLKKQKKKTKKIILRELSYTKLWLHRLNISKSTIAINNNNNTEIPLSLILLFSISVQPLPTHNRLTTHSNAVYLRDAQQRNDIMKVRKDRVKTSVEMQS